MRVIRPGLGSSSVLLRQCLFKQLFRCLTVRAGSHSIRRMVCVTGNRQLHIILFGNPPGQRFITAGNALFIVSLAEIRNHILILDLSGNTVCQGAFQSITHFNPGLAVAGRNQHQHAVIFFLVSNAPLPKNLQRIIFQRSPFQTWYRNHHQLGRSLLVKLTPQALQITGNGRRKHSGIILYVNTGGNRWFRRNLQRSIVHRFHGSK